MRADRLVAIVLMLQLRSKVTAGEVAEELEISERTARRDLEALGIAGLPVYSMQGRGGGWRLLGGGTTDLSGLTAPEVRALFLSAGSAAASATSSTTRAALRKLVRALPESMRADAETVQDTILVDEAGWDRTTDRAMSAMPPLLDAVQRLVIDGQQAELVYVARTNLQTTRIVHPLGVAAKGPIWYLIAQTDAGQRTFRIDRIVSIAATGERVVRPAGFVLSDAWASIVSDVNDRRLPVTASVHVSADAVRLVRSQVGSRLTVGGPVESPMIRQAVAGEIRGHSPRAIAGQLAGFGGIVYVVEPAAVRIELARCGRELVELYS